MSQYAESLKKIVGILKIEKKLADLETTVTNEGPNRGRVDQEPNGVQVQSSGGKTSTPTPGTIDKGAAGTAAAPTSTANPASANGSSMGASIANEAAAAATITAASDVATAAIEDIFAGTLQDQINNLKAFTIGLGNELRLYIDGAFRVPDDRVHPDAASSGVDQTWSYEPNVGYDWIAAGNQPFTTFSGAYSTAKKLRGQTYPELYNTGGLVYRRYLGVYLSYVLRDPPIGREYAYWRYEQYYEQLPTGFGATLQTSSFVYYVSKIPHSYLNTALDSNGQYPTLWPLGYPLQITIGIGEDGASLAFLTHPNDPSLEEHYVSETSSKKVKDGSGNTYVMDITSKNGIAFSLIDNATGLPTGSTVIYPLYNSSPPHVITSAERPFYI